MPKVHDRHDEFVISENDKKTNKKLYLTIGGLGIACLSALYAHKTGLFKHNANKIDDILNISEFKKIEEAKAYFEKLGIETDLRGATKEHLPLLNRIKENLKQLKEMGVKKDKPDSIIISDWTNASEYEELCRAKGINIERRENYWAFCGHNSGKDHIFINSNKPNFDMFRHEMGHANDFAHDSFMHSKGNIGYDFAEKQLGILGHNSKIYRGTRDFDNIFRFNPPETNTTFTFPNEKMEKIFAHAENMLTKMQEETHCYAPEVLIEQKAYIFEELLKGKTFSDEVMLYYDFTGGARIPNLKINGKTYDEYIESLYNNSELIQKLKDNVKISKL